MSGYFVALARDCFASMFDCAVMQMKKLTVKRAIKSKFQIFHKTNLSQSVQNSKHRL